VFAKNTFDQHAQLRPHVLPQRPVDRHVRADGTNQFLGNSPQRRLAEHLDRAVVGLQGVVKGKFLFGKTKLFPLKTASDGSCLLEVAMAPGYTEHLGCPEIPKG